VHAKRTLQEQAKWLITASRRPHQDLVKPLCAVGWPNVVASGKCAGRSEPLQPSPMFIALAGRVCFGCGTEDESVPARGSQSPEVRHDLGESKEPLGCSLATAPYSRQKILEPRRCGAHSGSCRGKVIRYGGPQQNQGSRTKKAGTETNCSSAAVPSHHMKTASRAG
jgi:hypothetical protein